MKKEIKTAGAVLGTIVVGLAAFTGIEHWLTPHDIFDLSMAAQEKVNQEIVNTLQLQQQQLKNQGDYNELIFYQQMELNLLKALADNPNDPNLKSQLLHIQDKKQKVQERLER